MNLINLMICFPVILAIVVAAAVFERAWQKRHEPLDDEDDLPPTGGVAA